MKIRESKRYFVLFYMLGFVLGILYANFLSEDYIANQGIFSGFFLKQYAQTEVDIGEYFWYVLKLRVMPIVFVGALGCTKARKVIVTAGLLWTGFSSSMMLTAAVMQMGVKGIILCLAALLPHFIFYVSACLILFWYLFRYPETKWNLSKTVCFGLLYMLGILLECYVNPIILKVFIGTL